VAFIHQLLGEIWYELNLCGEDRGGVRIPQMRTELGKVNRYEVLVENPMDREVPFQVELSNDANFTLVHPFLDMILPPSSSTPMYIQFTPSGLTTHTGEVLIHTNEVGKWLFLCLGVGVVPTPY
jgi:hypothetical protein